MQKLGALKGFEGPCLGPGVAWPGVDKPGLPIHGGGDLSKKSFGGSREDGEGRMDETEKCLELWAPGPEAEPPGRGKQQTLKFSLTCDRP